MVLTLSDIQPPAGSKRRKKRVGRGNASGRGTYSSRGVKGQRARSGGKRGLKLRGLKQYILRLPKRRGFTSPHRKMVVVNIQTIAEKFQEREVVEPFRLLQKGLITTTFHKVKILGKGSLSKALHVRAHAFSKQAKNAITQAGGTAEVIIKKKHSEDRDQATASGQRSSSSREV